jgi:hypothetical protein
MIGFASLLLAVTVVQNRSDNLGATATLVAPATCTISAKAAPDVTIRIDPKNGWVANPPGVVARLRLVFDSGLPEYSYNGGAFPVQGVPVSNGAGTSYTFTFRTPILSIRGEAGTPPKVVEQGGRIFALTHEEHGWLVVELIAPNETGNGSNVTEAGLVGTGHYRIGPCKFEP